jgi:hypothetical protein
MPGKYILKIDKFEQNVFRVMVLTCLSYTNKEKTTFNLTIPSNGSDNMVDLGKINYFDETSGILTNTPNTIIINNSNTNMNRINIAADKIKTVAEKLNEVKLATTNAKTKAEEAKKALEEANKTTNAAKKTEAKKAADEANNAATKAADEAKKAADEAKKAADEANNAATKAIFPISEALSYSNALITNVLIKQYLDDFKSKQQKLIELYKKFDIISSHSSLNDNARKEIDITLNDIIDNIQIISSLLNDIVKIFQNAEISASKKYLQDYFKINNLNISKDAIDNFNKNYNTQCFYFINNLQNSDKSYKKITINIINQNREIDPNNLPKDGYIEFEYTSSDFNNCKCCIIS